MNDIAAAPEGLPGIGHNQPPLGEELAIVLAPLSDRAKQLLGVAETALIVDDLSATKIVDLSALIQALERELDLLREERKAPFLAAGRLVDSTFNPVIEQLTTARLGPEVNKRRTGGLRGMLTAYQQRREAEAAEARRKAEEEQRRREAEAEEARRKAEEARQAQQGGSIKADLDAIAAEEAAAAAQRRAEAIRPEPIRAQLGQMSARRDIAFDITDLRKLLGWMLKQPMKSNLEAEARKMMAAYLKTLGVDAVERGGAENIPGIAVRIEKQAAIRR